MRGWGLSCSVRGRQPHCCLREDVGGICWCGSHMITRLDHMDACGCGYVSILELINSLKERDTVDVARRKIQKDDESSHQSHVGLQL